MSKTKVPIPKFKEYKQEGKKVTMITVYDYPMAALVDQSEAEMILVGDSLGMVVLGYDDTVPVTMDEVIHHLKAVKRGAKNTIVVGDMPFMSYQASVEDAVRNAGRLVKEGGADCVKLEGGLPVAPKIKAIVDAGIPVVGHIGLTPQSASQLGGFKVQGKSKEDAERLLKEAIAIDQAGAYAMVLECIPASLAKMITANVKANTISVGAGADCDGQNLNGYDILGLFDKFVPKFVKQYAKLSTPITEAFTQFTKEVRSGEYPQQNHCFTMADEDLPKLY
ncbi:MAG: 3-methyl-2-oxobutanoate hydroxymethyltransferase [Peptococcaceae bacterium]